MDKNIKNPKVTVLMPVYNGQKYLRKAIDSILNQTFTDFEFLIINDGSTDNTEKIIKSYSDPRIRLINNKKNLGLVTSLNNGIDLAKGKYIARMDCDDISLPNRLKYQLKFMDNNPKIKISGTWAKTIGDKKKIPLKKYTKPKDIKANLLFETAFIHPTVIIKKIIIKKYNLYYDKHFQHSEDKELWERASNYFPLANLNKILLLRRVHAKSISKTYSNIQKENGNKTIARQLKKFEINPSKEKIKIHRSIKPPPDYKKEDFLYEIKKWFNELIIKNKQKKIINEKSLKKILQNRWLFICYNLSDQGFWAWKQYRKSTLSHFSNTTNYEIIFKFLIRCLLKKSPN